MLSNQEPGSALTELRDLLQKALRETADLRARLDAQAKIEIASQASLDSRYVNVSGDTMTGSLVIDTALGIGVGGAGLGATGTVRASVNFQARVDGSGGGFFAGAASDVQLYRAGSGLWRTPDSLQVDSLLRLAGSNMRLAGANFTLADDATQDLLLGNLPYAFIFIRDTTEGHTALLHTRGGVTTAHVIWEVVAGSWATADTDTKHCIFHDGATKYVIKNRRGANRTYYVIELGIG